MTPDHLALLTQEEGTRATVYDDATGQPIVPGTRVIGHPTIGIGRALDVHGISQSEIAYLLQNDIAQIELALSKLTWWVSLNQARKDVITDMAFNMGMAHMLQFTSMIHDISVGDFANAAVQMSTSAWAKEAPNRVPRLAQTMRTGVL